MTDNFMAFAAGMLAVLLAQKAVTYHNQKPTASETVATTWKDPISGKTWHIYQKWRGTFYEAADKFEPFLPSRTELEGFAEHGGLAMLGTSGDLYWSSSIYFTLDCPKQRLRVVLNKGGGISGLHPDAVAGVLLVER